jgi:hypothetical protein
LKLSIENELLKNKIKEMKDVMLKSAEVTENEFLELQKNSLIFELNK